MANSTSTYQAGILAAVGASFSPSKAPLTRKRRTAVFQINIVGSHATGDYYDLGQLNTAGVRIHPESCKLRFGGSGSVDFKAQLKKVDAVTGANAVALTAVSAEINATSAAISLAAPDGSNTVLLAVDDMLRLYVTYGTGTTITIPSTLIVYVEVAYDVE